MLYIPKVGNYNNIVNFLYYLFSFTPFLHNKTVVAIATFFLRKFRRTKQAKRASSNKREQEQMGAKRKFRRAKQAKRASSNNVILLCVFYYISMFIFPLVRNFILDIVFNSKFFH